MSIGSQLPAHKQPLLAEDTPPLIAPGDLQFILAAGFILGLRMLPPSLRPRFLMRMSRVLGTFWYRSNMRDVRRVRHHLKLLFPERWSFNGDGEQVVCQQLRLTVWNFITLNLIPTLSSEQSLQLLPVDGLDQLQTLHGQGASALLMGAHVGPYAYPIAAVMQANGLNVYEVGHARPRQGSSRLYRKLYWPRVQDTCRHMQIIDPLKGGQTELLDVIRCGNVLFLLPDQLYVVPPGTPRSPHLVPIDYLGHTVNLETGGLRLCKRLETAVFTALPTFIDNQYRIKIEPFELPTTGLNPPALAADLQHFMNKVAGCIQKQPFLWRDLRRADLLPRLGIPETT